MHMKKKHDLGDIITGGQFYGRMDSGHMEPLGPDAPGDPDAWICRRVADYPGQRVPEGGAVAACEECDAPIVFNPKREVQAPKVCMQCCAIEPLPMD
jgi:hypothetical protein